MHVTIVHCSEQLLMMPKMAIFKNSGTFIDSIASFDDEIVRAKDALKIKAPLKLDVHYLYE